MWPGTRTRGRAWSAGPADKDRGLAMNHRRKIVPASTISRWAYKSLAEACLSGAVRVRDLRELRKQDQAAQIMCSCLRSYFDFAIRLIGRRAGELGASLQKNIFSGNAFHMGSESPFRRMLQHFEEINIRSRILIVGHGFFVAAGLAIANRGSSPHTLKSLL